ncbi:thioredoxin domain-containing protein [Candidatus Woesearchaeota archaeon]|jgi:protein-disulfide isomerase|nr:thioredoxin domain-containing protein [Candidatus Woesearchaeota archaeon]MBT6023260.1 thioredoxin domain-containing protein [Candidatus Woesearchaeota archaeon]
MTKDSTKKDEKSKTKRKPKFILIGILLLYTYLAFTITTTPTDLMQYTENQVSFMLSENGGTAQANSITALSGLYSVNLDIIVSGQTQNIDAFITPDGSLMILGDSYDIDKSLVSGEEYEIPRAEIPLGDRELTLGNPNAPVTFVEFSDVECPFCERFYNDGLAGIKKLVEQGKVYFVYKHFPIQGHNEAIPGALAIECAADQGKWVEMHDLIFENQDSLGASQYKSWAVQIGIDATEFNNCFNSEKYLSKINADYQLGQSIGVTGTPKSFANGISISGAQPFTSFENIILSEIEAGNA